ncbi:uncharacterized protein LOC141607632 [Silene latifolia]|uniref:uncharacterized protein LOC141607632 n=1 Tax=Silene latifolia TaxID=37657 RepID=UPI003D7710D8
MGMIVGIPPLNLETFVEDVDEEESEDDDMEEIPIAKAITRFIVLSLGHFLFDNKPLIVKPWNPDIELVKHDVKTVLVWVKLYNLPLKFWGKGISRISGLFGEFIKCDPNTEDKTRLGYARVMIEVAFVESIPDKVQVLDEHECKKAKKTPQFTSQPTKKKPATQFWRPKNVDKHVIQQSKGKEKIADEEQPTHPVAIQFKTPVVWHRSSKYSMGYTPARSLMRLARQAVTDGAYTVQKFGQSTFMEALNNSSTPKEGIGISGNVPHPWWGMYNTGLWNVRGLKNPTKQRQVKCMRVTEIATSNTFIVYMVYAFNDLNGRKGLWDQLALFAATIQEPWLVCGDFNCDLSFAERLGGVTCDQEIDDFQICVSRCGLLDASARGSFFTWNNKQDLESRRYSRLDRALINEEWSNCMPDVLKVS